MADHEALWPCARRAAAINDLPLKAIVTAVRYDNFDVDDVYIARDGIRWIKLETVFNSKRRFNMHYTFGEFSMGVMNSNRLQIYYNEERSWISAKPANRQPGAGRMRNN
jgi:hypothetical protein